MRRSTLGACACALAIVLSAGYAQAQQQDSPMRYVTVTTFDVPYGPDRAKVMSFLNEYMLPATQLNPSVKNFRLLTHVWGKRRDAGHHGGGVRQLGRHRSRLRAAL